MDKFLYFNIFSSNRIYYEQQLKLKIQELEKTHSELLNKEKVKNNKMMLQNRKLRRLTRVLRAESKKKDAVIKAAKKANEKQRNHIEQVHFERMKFNEQVEAAHGAVSAKVKENLIRGAMKGMLSKAQMDRILMKKNTRWSSDDIMAATILLSHSSRAYRFIREEMKYPLPAVSTLRARIAKLPVEAGILKAALLLMKSRAQCMSPLHRVACLSFDEVHISGDYVYDSQEDRVLGGCSKTQVVMIRGLFAPWKGPVYYDHDQPMTEELLDFVITEVHQAGFLVVTVVSDMGSENAKLYRNMGVNDECPYFLHPATGSRISCFHDPPHLLKLARNHLIDQGFVLNPEERGSEKQIACVEPLQQLVKLSPGRDVPLHSVTQIHLVVHGSERQIVELAAQVLSQKTAVAILDAGIKHLIQSKHYEVLKIKFKLNVNINHFPCRERANSAP